MKHRITRREFLAGVAAGIGMARAAGLGNAARAAGMGNAARAAGTAELILCGWDEVFIIEAGGDAGGKLAGKPEKVWSWRATECPDIPEAMKRAFRSTDDCKPVDGGRRILISSSQGAVALVERASKRALFHAPVINAHSIEMLPKGRIAAASSVNEAPGANRIIIFDVETKAEVASDRLVSAHGAVWDERRGVLWALGGNELRAYRIVDGGGKVELKKEYTLKLPDDNGHDLAPIPGGAGLFVSTGKHCWVFDRDTRKLEKHETLGDAAKIKGYTVHPASGRVAWVQAEGSNWWTERVHFEKPKGELRLEGERLYKARWNAG